MRNLILLLVLLSFNVKAFDPFTVSDIRILGADRISHGTIFSYLPIERGDVVDADTIRNGIQSVFSTGYFHDVKMLRENDVLIVKVDERPAIATIRISGNKSIKTEELMQGLNSIGLSEGEVFDQLELDKVKNELVTQFFSRGKYNVKIDTNVKELDRNRVMVNINIDEGKSAKIKHIKIVGNTVFSDEELIDAFESDTSNWLSWYSQDDQYSKEKLNGDLEKLKSYYLDRGYVNAEVESVQVTISNDKKDIYLTANIQEGDQYKFGKQELTGNLIFDKSIMEKYLITSEGSIFSQNKIEMTNTTLKAVLANRGYAFAEIQPITQPNEDDKTVDVTFFVLPGKKVYVRRINFIGNTKTKDEVLRREMRQFEGAWFSQVLIDRSKLRLQQKPYFEEVNIETEQVPGTDDQIDVNVTVKERNSGQFTFGLGFSQVSGLNFSTSVSLQNLLGTGNTLSVAVNTSDFYKRLNLLYENPYFTDDGISLGYTMNFTNINQGDANIAQYNSTNGSLGVQASFPITEYDRIYTNLAYERISLRANESFTAQAIVDDLLSLGGYAYSCFNRVLRPENDEDLPRLTEQCFPDEIIPPATGEDGETIQVPLQYRRAFSLFKAQARWARDSRNRYFNPTRGAYHSIGFEASLPSSTAEFYKINVKENILFPLTDKLTLSLRGELGYGDGYGNTNGLPFFENFFAGGVSSVRGYDDNTLGPKSSVGGVLQSELGLPTTSRSGDPIGGAFKVVGSAEIVFPTPFAKDSSNAARLAWFFDVGNVFDDVDSFEARELRMATGFALKWQAPVGPIVISYAYPFNKDKLDRTERLQFTFGNTF
ncbi:outer membrane protein assembly factor BamA [Marinicella litoralis]|uniref:Outer membrane protein assembly factor BamA n=1 Tax=Marinicella litoralis TaxID=644220 RepID=A0A4R6XNE4_9GAMM|nr:outer membrane protein assembly factor BamA [Marinicella litoralis]TDR19474.1 Beta-barrel assembly machine subunit BamA [Marinicella litoralis]